MKLFPILFIENVFHVFQDVEEFVDVHKLRIVKKIVRPISQQQENESRRLWKEVTAGLKFNDIEKATQAKADLEQKQRNEAKERKAQHLEWETNVRCPHARRTVVHCFLFSAVQKV